MDSFDQRKKSILEKEDKAAKGSWDSRVIELCNKLNSMDDYYTTSSCSGKSVIMEEKIGKDGSYYLWSSHELLNFDEIYSKLFASQIAETRPTHPNSERISRKINDVNVKDIVKFKAESPILFVCCRDIEKAKELLNKAVEAGFKESGIKITNKLIAVEIRSGEKIEFPILSCGKILVGDEFLKVLVDLVNNKRERGWGKIKKFLLSLD